MGLEGLGLPLRGYCWTPTALSASPELREGQGQPTQGYWGAAGMGMAVSGLNPARLSWSPFPSSRVCAVQGHSGNHLWM